MDDAGDVAEDCQQDVYPEVLADPHLQEHPQGREQYRDYDTEHVHRNLPFSSLTFLPTTLPDPGGCIRRRDYRQEVRRPELLKCSTLEA